MGNANKIIKTFCIFVIVLVVVAACWVGLEYELEGAVHNSDVDGIFAIILSYMITSKVVSLEENNYES